MMMNFRNICSMIKDGIYQPRSKNVVKDTFSGKLTSVWAPQLWVQISGTLITMPWRASKTVRERRLVGVLQRLGTNFLTRKMSAARRKCGMMWRIAVSGLYRMYILCTCNVLSVTGLGLAGRDKHIINILRWACKCKYKTSLSLSSQSQIMIISWLSLHSPPNMSTEIFNSKSTMVEWLVRYCKSAIVIASSLGKLIRLRCTGTGSCRCLVVCCVVVWERS